MNYCVGDFVLRTGATQTEEVNGNQITKGEVYEVVHINSNAVYLRGFDEPYDLYSFTLSYKKPITHMPTWF